MVMTLTREKTKKPRDTRKFRSKDWGKFSCRLAVGVMTFDGTRNYLTLEGVKERERLAVPDFMLAEAKQVMRRGGGDKVLEFARLCIVHEVALAAWRPAKTKKTKKVRTDA